MDGRGREVRCRSWVESLVRGRNLTVPLQIMQPLEVRGNPLVQLGLNLGIPSLARYADPVDYEIYRPARVLRSWPAV